MSILVQKPYWSGYATERLTLNQAEDWLRQKVKEGKTVELVEK